MKLQDFLNARRILADPVGTSPLWFSPLLSKRTGKRVWLKMECLLPSNSFKIRPAYFGIHTHLSEAKEKGVIAGSSGNFAQGVALAAKMLGVNAEIVMPESTRAFKIERTRGFGAKVTLSGPSFADRLRVTEERRKATGAVELHPFNSEETILGDGSIGLELLEQVRGPFPVLIPSSGGGLAAGIVTALRLSEAEFEAVGVQSENNGSLSRSLQAGTPTEGLQKPTLADALVAARPGERSLSLLRGNLRAMEVSEGKLREAFEWMVREHRILAEPSSCAPVCLLLEGLATRFSDVVCILSGANFEIPSLNSVA